jgi:hypothetical protein
VHGRDACLREPVPGGVLVGDNAEAMVEGRAPTSDVRWREVESRCSSGPSFRRARTEGLRRALIVADSCAAFGLDGIGRLYWEVGCPRPTVDHRSSVSDPRTPLGSPSRPRGATAEARAPRRKASARGGGQRHRRTGREALAAVDAERAVGDAAAMRVAVGIVALSSIVLGRRLGAMHRAQRRPRRGSLRNVQLRRRSVPRARKCGRAANGKLRV